jgi:hypothetical protein
MKWSGEGDLAELWRRAGLTDVRFGALQVSASYESFDDLWAPLESGVAPPGAFYKSLDDEGRTQLYEVLRRHLGVGDEPFELAARAWAAVGTVAAT